jgi:predicted nucleotide-binding protein
MKNYKMILSLLAFLVIVVSSSFLSDTFNQPSKLELGGWIKLGTQTVSPGVDHDVLMVTEIQQTYNHLKIKVSKAPVHLRNIDIIYNDNTSESHLIERQLKKGASSRNLDLMGYGRVIKQVIFIYSGRNSGKGAAQLEVLARL